MPWMSSISRTRSKREPIGAQWLGSCMEERRTVTLSANTTAGQPKRLAVITDVDAENQPASVSRFKKQTSRFNLQDSYGSISPGGFDTAARRNSTINP